MKMKYSKFYSLLFGCLLSLTACIPNSNTAATATPFPIEIPPPVEQKNTELTIFYTDSIQLQATILDMAVGQYNREHPDNPVTAEKVFTDSSDTVRDEETQQMLTQVMAGEGPI